MPRLTPMIMMGGNSHPQLLQQIASHLDTKPCDLTASKFKNGETRVAIHKSVRDADVFLMQTGTGHKVDEDEEGLDTTLNDSCMELLIIASGVRLASAKRLVAVLPYFPYSKQSKQKRRGTIPARLFADLLKTAGVQHVITLDLHHMQMQGFFSTPIDNVKSSPLIIDYIREQVPEWQSHVIVSKNAGALKRAALIAKRLQLQLAMITGEQYKYAEALSEERQAGDGSLAAATREQETMMEEVEDEAQGDGIIGSVTGRSAIVVDDILDTAGSFISAARLLKANGATSVRVVATHGLLSGDAPEQLNTCADIDSVAVTNSTPQTENLARCAKLQVIDASFVLAEAIRRVHNGEALYGLYTGKLQKPALKWRQPSAATPSEAARSRSSTKRNVKRASMTDANARQMPTAPSGSATSLLTAKEEQSGTTKSS